MAESNDNVNEQPEQPEEIASEDVVGGAETPDEAQQERELIRRLIAQGTLDQLRQETDADTLEDMFLQLTLKVMTLRR